MSRSLCVPVCLCVCLSVCPSVFSSIFLFVCMSLIFSLNRSQCPYVSFMLYKKNVPSVDHWNRESWRLLVEVCIANIEKLRSFFFLGFNDFLCKKISIYICWVFENPPTVHSRGVSRVLALVTGDG